MPRSLPAPLILLPLALAACSAKPTDQENLDSLDAELTNSAAADQPGKDPALMSALQSQIMVDPALAQQANADAVRPPDQPYAAPIPADAPAPPPANGAPVMKTPEPKADCPQCEIAKQSVTLGALAARQKAPGTAACVANIRYSNAWANRLPRDIPLYPQAQVTEAAGNSANGCALRVVSFVSGASVQQVLDYYYTRTTSTGYRSDHQAADGEHVLGGNRDRDGAAFVLFARPRDGGGSDVDLIVNTGS